MKIKTGKVLLWECRPGLPFWIPPTQLLFPRMQVLSGAFDTLSHAMETYLGNSDQDNVSDDVALAIMKNTVANMRRLLKDINDMEARGNLMWDSAMAENGYPESRTSYRFPGTSDGASVRGLYRL